MFLCSGSHLHFEFLCTFQAGVPYSRFSLASRKGRKVWEPRRLAREYTCYPTFLPDSRRILCRPDSTQIAQACLDLYSFRAFDYIRLLIWSLGALRPPKSPLLVLCRLGMQWPGHRNDLHPHAPRDHRFDLLERRNYRGRG